jgi:hypothetical protein
MLSLAALDVPTLYIGFDQRTRLSSLSNLRYNRQMSAAQ